MRVHMVVTPINVPLPCYLGLCIFMPLSILPDQWTEHFRGLAGLPLDLKAKLTHRAVPIQVDAKHEIFGPGHAPEHILLLIEGRIRVQQVSEQGREIVLYRVKAVS